MKILVIQGSPDVASYSQELASAYAEEASRAGHEVRTIDLATEDFDPNLRYGYRQHMEDESAPQRYQELIAWADHLVFSFPIWWSAEPAILKGFIDRTFTPRFAYRFADGKSEPKLTGKTAALILTSRASALIYRLFGGPVPRWTPRPTAPNSSRRYDATPAADPLRGSQPSRPRARSPLE